MSSEKDPFQVILVQRLAALSRENAQLKHRVTELQIRQSVFESELTKRTQEIQDWKQTTTLAQQAAAESKEILQNESRRVDSVLDTISTNIRSLYEFAKQMNSALTPHDLFFFRTALSREAKRIDQLRKTGLWTSTESVLPTEVDDEVSLEESEPEVT